MIKPKTTIIITHKFNDTRVAILENGRLVEFYIEREGIENNVGKIFKGKVENIVKGLRGAFVNIGLRKNGFLPLAEIPEEIFGIDLEEEEEKIKRPKKEELPINIGDQIFCQVVKEQIGEKGARLTSFIHLPGKYVVFFPTISRIGVSQRIANKKERNRLKEIAKKLKKPNRGLIIRTAAENMPEEVIVRDYHYLEGKWEEIEREFQKSRAPRLLYREPKLALKIVRDLYTLDTEAIYIDDRNLYYEICNYIKNYTPELFNKDKIIFYEDKEPIFKKFKIDEELEKALAREIPLKSGGFITIDQTEALVTIDVNTGSFASEEDPETLILQTNLEAAAEIARQIRLRDLSGLIIIDFIDMREQKNRERVYQELKLCLANDRAKADFGKLSRFGLVEMTREKTRPSLFFTLCEECPACKGRGRILDRYEVCLKIESYLINKTEKIKGKKILLLVSPYLYEFLTNEWNERLNQLIKKIGVHLELKMNPKFKYDEYKFLEEI
ncbi:MAG: Rne/Rng family ribonuclease [candidate division WOR-3 bacterium]|uniref:Rne/Rng family ribonuclease n=1 Tax=candidate division WOR-3 bacterium TaxID=2052148 RepID=A0A7V4CHH6_UNCW3